MSNTPATLNRRLDAKPVRIPAYKPMMHSPKEACTIIGCGMTHLYSLIGAKLIEAVKSGRKTLIPAASLQNYLAGLPSATITTGRRSTKKVDTQQAA